MSDSETPKKSAAQLRAEARRAKLKASQADRMKEVLDGKQEPGFDGEGVSRQASEAEKTIKKAKDKKAAEGDDELPDISVRHGKLDLLAISCIVFVINVCVDTNTRYLLDYRESVCMMGAIDGQQYVYHLATAIAGYLALKTVIHGVKIPDSGFFVIIRTFCSPFIGGGFLDCTLKVFMLIANFARCCVYSVVAYTVMYGLQNFTEAMIKKVSA